MIGRGRKNIERMFAYKWTSWVALRPPDMDSGITILRLMDIAIWMRYSRGRHARNVRHQHGLMDP
jgi:hypothetical protein